jgi:enoyl-[acyl-carrier protein] reductase I
MTDFLQLENKRILVFGVANKKSVAYRIAKTLEEVGAEVVYVVRSPERKQQLEKLLSGKPIYVCDVEHQQQIDELATRLKQDYQGSFYGLVHSIAFADYSSGILPFHQTTRQQFLQAVDISCFSLMALCAALEASSLLVSQPRAWLARATALWLRSRPRWNRHWHS